MALNNAGQLAWIGELYRLGQSGALRENPAEVQDRILQHIVAGFEASSGALAICEDAAGESMAIVAGVGLPSDAIGSTIKPGEGVLGWVVEKGEALLLNGDISSDARFSNMRARVGSTRPSSAMCWPLKLENRVIGALSINRVGDRKAYAAEDLEHGGILVSLITVVIENAQLHIEQQRRIKALGQAEEQLRNSHHELEKAYRQLQDTQGQLLQSEKLAAVGQLAAGVAHEINNPIGYVYSNLGSLQKYLQDIFLVTDAYEKIESLPGLREETLAEIHEIKERVDFGFLQQDIVELMSESREGITRVKKIVQDLKDFSHAGSDEEWQWADLLKGLDSTLNIVWNEIKYKAEVIKEYGEVPEIECLPSQLNQVFMNLLVNASHAIEEQGTITIRTATEGDSVWMEVADTGAGIKPELMNRIFDPFFTTKPVGKGTGLGLSVSYSIIQKHHGSIDVASEPGKGTTFRITLPVKQPEPRPEEKTS